MVQQADRFEEVSNTPDPGPWMLDHTDGWALGAWAHVDQGVGQADADAHRHWDIRGGGAYCQGA